MTQLRTAGTDLWLPGDAREEWSQPEATSDVLIDTIMDPFYVVDWRGQVRNWNDRFNRVLGYTDDEMADLDPLTCIAPPDREKAKSVLSRVAVGEEVSADLRIATKDGEWIPHECTAAPLTDESGDPWGFVGTARDISDRKAREQHLRRYEQLLETVGDGVFVLDRSGTVSRVNEALARMLGRDRESLVGRDLSVLLTDRVDEVDLSPRAFPEGRSGLEIDATLRRPDGSTLPVRGRCSLVGGPDGDEIVGHLTDVRGERERSELLEELHGGFRELMDAETVAGVAETAAAVLQRHFSFATTGVRLLDGDRLEMVAVETDMDYDPEMPPSYRIGEGFVGRAYESGEPTVVADLQAVITDFEYWPVRSALLLPIPGYGMLSIGSTEPDAFDELDRDLGRLFAADVESALRRAEREEQLRERKRDLQRYETLVETTSDGIYMTDEAFRITAVNDAAANLLGQDREALLGRDVRSFFDDDAIERFDAQCDRLLAGTDAVGSLVGSLAGPDGDDVAVENRFSLLPAADGEFSGTVGVMRDVTERQEREQRLRTQRDELETLNRINELVQETIGALASAATAEEIERTVCIRLAESSLYRFAFTGRRLPGREFLQPQVWAGEGEAYLDTVEIPVDTTHDRAGPAARTCDTGEITVTHDVESDPLFEPFRDPALDHGFRSVAVVPFAHGDVVHGVLAVYADRPGAFSSRELQAFEVLGEMVGFAISATKNRRLIESDVPIEVTFTVSGENSFFASLSSALDARCRLLGSAKASDGTLHYVAASGVTVDAVEDAVDRVSAAGSATIKQIRSGEAETVFEIRLAESIPALLVESGIKPVEVVAADGVVTVVGEAPRDVNLRAVTDRLESNYGEASLASKRNVPGAREPTVSLRERFDDLLTDRQRATLKAAYFGGYFDWPRESTAEDVADSLDISSATFHQHLRHAQQKLVGEYLDGAGW